MERPLQVIVLGGGAAGFFAAIACAEAEPSAKVSILERSAQVLAKVKVSGGGRCNVTHACFDPAVLVTRYPRGGAALRGPFTRFQPRDTMAWFESRGIALKTEADGRIFPATNLSQTIIDGLLAAAQDGGVSVEREAVVQSVRRRPESEGSGFALAVGFGSTRIADRLILATGSNPAAWAWARALGHTVEPPVPSLFTFTIPDPRLEGLAGITVGRAVVALEESTLAQAGPLLITHWGLSGPAVITLSAWAARWLHSRDYEADLRLNWIPDVPEEAVLRELRQTRSNRARSVAPGDSLFNLPKRLWDRLSEAAGFRPGMRWTEVSNDQLLGFARELQQGRYRIRGKSPFKEEFVTCGGVRLDEVDFRTMQSKRCPGLYLAGEVLDIDGVTGGFNFQSAWTTGWIAGRSAAVL